MKQLNVGEIIKACDRLQRLTVQADGCMSSSVRCFDACMRAFDSAALPAQAITFKVFLNAPVMEYGEITIYRDGHMEIRRTE